MYHQNSVDIFNAQMLANKVEKLEEQDVHLWSTHKDIYDELKKYSDYFLNEDEQNRAQRFRYRKQHDLFVVGRTITKIMLAYYTESTPESVNITTDSFGKPTCEKNLFFNISHSDNQLLLGFSKSDIGVDIERNDPTVDIERIGESHFSKMELQKMMNFTKDERADAFFEIWTKKESVIKGIGKGLSIPLQNFNVSNRNGKVLWELPVEKSYGDWYVQNIETKRGFKSAFATQNGKVDLCYYCYEN